MLFNLLIRIFIKAQSNTMILLIIAATIPVVFLATLAYIKDTEKEPISLLIKSFILGIFIVLPIIMVELILDSGIQFFVKEQSIVNSFLQAFVVAGLVEESFKYMATLFVLRKNKYYDQFYDGIVYAVFVSLGFAFLENILYVVEHGMQTAIIRGLLTVPAHALFGVAMGYYISLSKMSNKKDASKNRFLALFVPICLHGLFNFFLIDMENQKENQALLVIVYLIGFFIFNIVLWRFGLKNIKKHIALDKEMIQKNGDQTTSTV